MCCNNGMCSLSNKHVLRLLVPAVALNSIKSYLNSYWRERHCTRPIHNFFHVYDTKLTYSIFFIRARLSLWSRNVLHTCYFQVWRVLMFYVTSKQSIVCDERSSIVCISRLHNIISMSWKKNQPHSNSSWHLWIRAWTWTAAPRRQQSSFYNCVGILLFRESLG